MCIAGSRCNLRGVCVALSDGDEIARRAALPRKAVVRAAISISSSGMQLPELFDRRIERAPAVYPWPKQ